MFKIKCHFRHNNSQGRILLVEKELEHQWINIVGNWFGLGLPSLATCQDMLAVLPMLFTLKVDVPILTCIFFTFNWLTLTSEIHFVKLHPEVASCLLSRGKRMYVPLGMRLLWKYIRNYFLVYQLFSHILLYLPNYKEYEAEILDLQLEKYGLSFDIKKCTTSGWALGDENVIGIRSFKAREFPNLIVCVCQFPVSVNGWQLAKMKKNIPNMSLLWNL